MESKANRKVVIVTGAAGGIGRAACERLVRKGWSVVAADLDAAKLAWTQGNAHIAAATADIATVAGNQSVVQLAEDRFGGLDAVLLNAGLPGSGSIDSESMELFDKLVAVNLRGTVLGIRAALPALRRRKGGAIVVTSSSFGLAGDAGFWAYAAVKHGLIGVVKSVAREVGWEGIRINAICPSSVRATGMSEGIERELPEAYDAIRRAVPLQRWAEPDEIAAAMEYLISPESSFVHGIALPVDGGSLAGSGLIPPSSRPAEFLDVQEL
jgi:meso-butanediol dehydrogenase / (S,S)-butanediol dehydrogenase / diacetyl reductase